MKWIRGRDFMDNSPRYTLVDPGRVEGEGTYCDNPAHPARWTGQVWQEKTWESGVRVKRYFGVAFDGHKEIAAYVGPFRTAKEAKKATEKALKEIMT